MPSYKRKAALPGWGLYDVADVTTNSERGKLKAALRAATKEDAVAEFKKWADLYNDYGMTDDSVPEVIQLDGGMK